MFCVEWGWTGCASGLGGFLGIGWGEGLGGFLGGDKRGEGLF